VHQEIRKHIAIYLDHQSKGKWKHLLNDVRWVCNTAYHTALKMSPYEALMGTVPPIDPLGIPRKEGHFDRFPAYYGIHRKQLFERRKLLQKNIAQAQERTIRISNAHSHKIPFKIGDYVLYKNHNTETKWDEAFLGPWKIVGQRNPVTFELDIDGARYVAHATYLKLFKGPIPEDFLNEEEDQEEESVPTPEEDEISQYVQSHQPALPWHAQADQTMLPNIDEEQQVSANAEEDAQIQATADNSMLVRPNGVQRFRNLIQFRYKDRNTPAAQQAQVYTRRVAPRADVTPSDPPAAAQNRPQRERRPNRRDDYAYY
jgi:hypothetical protein